MIESIKPPPKSIATIVTYSFLKYSSNIQRKAPSVKKTLALLQYQTVTSVMGRRLFPSFIQTVVANAQKNVAIQAFPNNILSSKPIAVTIHINNPPLISQTTLFLQNRLNLGAT